MADNNAPFDPGPNQPTNPQVGNGPNTPAGPNFNRHTGTFLAPNNPGPLPPSRQSPPTWQSPPFIGTPPTSLFQDLSGDSLAVAEHDTIIDDCMRSVTVDDVTPSTSATDQTVVDVYVNGTWRGTANAPILSHGFEHVEVLLTGCCLKVGDLVQATQTVHGVVSGLSPGVRVVSHVQTSCLTQHYDMQRTGWFPYETKLSPSATNWQNFGQKIQLPVDGKVYAQPLYMHHQYFPNMAEPLHNVIFLATENDSVFAYDADLLGEKVNGVYNGVLLWQRSLLTDGTRAVNTDQTNNPDILCPDISPKVGISSTPVIDCGCHVDCDCDSGCASGCGCSPSCRTATMYVVTKSVSSTDKTLFHLYLHALDVTTGLERPNSPVEVVAPGFAAKLHNSRPGLLLLNGVIYAGFASHCDISDDFGIYHGWVISYDAISLKQKNVFCTTPDGFDGGVWQSGMGLASDGVSIYCVTGNGKFDGGQIVGNDGITDGTTLFTSAGTDFTGTIGRIISIGPKGQFTIVSVVSRNAVTLSGSPSAGTALTFTLMGGRDFGDSVLKLSPDLKLLSFFTPADQSDESFFDDDLGSGGVLILPDPQPGANANLLVTCGKAGDIWVLDRNKLGGFSGLTPNPNYAAPDLNDNPNVVSVTELQPGIPRLKNDDSPGPWGGAAYFNSSNGPLIFYCGNGKAVPGSGKLTSFRVTSGVLLRNGNSSESFLTMGSTPVVSSNQQANGIVWAVNRGKAPNGVTPISLRAYNANDLTQSLHPGDGWPIGTWASGRALLVPTILSGKVYVACEDHIGVFF